MASTIEKDDPLFGKAFSDTKPMTEDPKEVAQRRSSFSTVGRKVLGLTEEEAAQATAMTHLGKRKFSDTTRPGPKAKKSKHDIAWADSHPAGSEDVEGARSRKRNKEPRERKASKEYRAQRKAEKQLEQAQNAGAGAAAQEVAATGLKPSKKRRRGSAKEAPDISVEQVATPSDADSIGKKKKRKQSKNKADPADNEMLLDNGAASASSEAVDAKPAKDKKRKRTKERSEQAETEIAQTAVDVPVDTEVKKQKKRRRIKHKTVDDVEGASNAATKRKSKKRKKAEADD